MYDMIYYCHRLHFLAASESMAGDFPRAKRAADELVGHDAPMLDDMLKGGVVEQESTGRGAPPSLARSSVLAVTRLDLTTRRKVTQQATVRLISIHL
jgi:hypothetical protein